MQVLFFLLEWEYSESLYRQDSQFVSRLLSKTNFSRVLSHNWTCRGREKVSGIINSY